MRLQTFTVYGVEERAGFPRPKLSFKCAWLPDMGFVPGSLAQALPQKNGIDFVLCDDLRGWHYSELVREAKEKGGRLVHARHGMDRGKPFPELTVTGSYLLNGGLSIGDRIVVQYGPGIIRARKFPGTGKLIPMGAVKDKLTGAHIPKVRLCGHWMNDLGFETGTLATAAAVPGSITFTLHGSTERYADAVRHCRKNKLKLVHIRPETNHTLPPLPCIGVTGSIVDKAGFGLGDMLTADCAPGLIKLQKLDLEKLGF